MRVKSSDLFLSTICFPITQYLEVDLSYSVIGKQMVDKNKSEDLTRIKKNKIQKLEANY